jgi:class 3 adenylate cyclase
LWSSEEYGAADAELKAEIGNDTPREFVAMMGGLSRLTATPDVAVIVRAGVHIGEVVLKGEAVRCIAVHVGRGWPLASPSGVLVSQTVKDLVAGSGLTFEDAGEHQLRGIPDRLRLYRVAG